ncbi:MAG: lipopolysaccharide biosynthesis protein, partial [Traorella sp.]
MEKSRTEYSMLNIFVGVVGYFLNTLLGFICRMVFVRTLATDYLGVNGLFSNILSMLSLAELGIGSAIVYALYKPLAEHDEDKIACLVKIYGTAYKCIGIIVGIIGLLLLPFLDFIVTEQPNINESIYLLYLLNLFNTASTYFFSYRSSLLIAAQRNYIVSGLSYIIAIIQNIVQMILLYTTHNYLGYLLVQTVGTFVFNVLVSHIAVVQFPYIKKKNIQPLPKEEKRKLFMNVRDLLIYKISSLLVNSTDNILITYFKGLATTGIASNYTLLVNTLNSLLSQVFNGLTASIGNHNAIESDEDKYDMFSFLNLMNFWIYGWAALGIIFCSSDLVRLCFGEKYVLSMSIPIIMAINFLLVGMMNAVWTYKHTLGLFRYGRSLQFVTGILNIFFSVLLGKIWGLFGILFATILARLFTSLWYDPYAIFVHGFKKSPLRYLKKYIYYVIVFLITSLITYFILKPFSFTGISGTLLKMLLCSVVVNI